MDGAATDFSFILGRLTDLLVFTCTVRHRYTHCIVSLHLLLPFPAPSLSRRPMYYKFFHFFVILSTFSSAPFPRSLFILILLSNYTTNTIGFSLRALFFPLSLPTRPQGTTRSPSSLSPVPSLSSKISSHGATPFLSSPCSPVNCVNCSLPWFFIVVQPQIPCRRRSGVAANTLTPSMCISLSTRAVLYFFFLSC